MPRKSKAQGMGLVQDARHFVGAGVIQDARHFVGAGADRLPHGHKLVMTHSFIDGNGILHHHHHHFEGEGIGDWFKNLGRKIRDTFKPVEDTFKPGGKIEQGLKDTFNPQLGRDIASTLIHSGIPALTGTIGSTLGALSGPLTGIAAGTAGTMLGDQAAKALGNKVGLGLRRGRLAKGSAEAKEHMRRIRGMKGSGIPEPRSRIPITDPSLMGYGLYA